MNLVDLSVAHSLASLFVGMRCEQKFGFSRSNVGSWSVFFTAREIRKIDASEVCIGLGQLYKKQSLDQDDGREKLFFVFLVSNWLGAERI